MLLIACGSESRQVASPSAPPITHATGTAALGLTRNADIIAYEINPQQRSCAHNSLPVIGQGQSDSQGDYNITLNLNEPFILFRLTGGSYIEEASDTLVNLLPGQALYAINRIDSLDNSRPMIISSLSSIHAGLFCYLIEQTEMTIAEAYLEAEGFITSYTGFDPRYVDYKDPTDVSNNHISIAFDNGLLLGLLNAGISQYSYDLSIRAEGNDIVHNEINSIYMAQHFFNDIYQDGSLNGQGRNGNIIISLNDHVERLTSTSYKFDLPRAILDFYDNNEHNAISKDRSKLYKIADTMNTVSHAIVFADQDDSPVLDEQAPEVIWMSPTTLSGTHNITLTVTDLTSVRDLVLIGREDIVINKISNSVYSFRLDTSSYASGEHQFSIIATDTLGNTDTLTTSVVLINDAPQIRVTSPSSTKDQSFRFEFGITKVHSRQQIDLANSKCIISSVIMPVPLEHTISAADDSFWCRVELQPTINNIQVVVCDTNSLCNSRATHSVKYDIEAPSIYALDLMRSYRGNVSFRIDVADELSDLNGLPRFSATGNGEVLQGEVLGQEATIVNDLNSSSYLVFFDATRFGNGNIDIEITASDTENNHGSQTFTTLVVNQPASAQLLSNNVFGGDYASFEFLIHGNSYQNIRVQCRVAGHTAITLVEYVPNNRNDANGGEATCSFFAPALLDGEVDLELTICGDYNLCNSQTFQIIKDTTPPSINCPFNSGYGGQNIQEITCAVNDINSAVSRVSYRNPEVSNTFIELVEPYSITLDPSIYPDGNYTIDISAEDELGNAVQNSYSFTVDRTPPVLLLSTRIHTRQDSIDISGTYQESSIASITCLSLESDSYQSFDIPANIGAANSFVCQNYAATNLNLEDRVGVEACDIYSNCALYYTRVLHDDRPPMGEVFAGHAHYNLALLGDDDLPANPATDLTVAQGAFTLNRDKTSINSEQQIDVAFLQENNYGFVAWRGRDLQMEIPHPVFNGLYKQLYASNSANLSVTYSYSQRNCTTDNGGNSYTDICPEANVEYYFQNKHLGINITADGLAEAVIPLTNEYLNAPDKSLWYLASVDSTIHRIDLYVCDETQNCLQYIARFRVNVLADGPVVNIIDLPATSINILRDINSFLTASHNMPIVTRVFEIVNPTEYPVYFTLATNQPPTPMFVQRQTYKRINAYYRRTTTVTYTGRTQTYSGGQTSSNRYRCNYRTSYSNVGGTVELFSDTFPASTGNIYTSGEVRHYGSCSRGGSRTDSFRAAGYPKNVASQYLTPLGTGSASELSFPMNYHSAVDENNVAYSPESYWLLAPGASKRITIQETLPLYTTYNNGDLPVPSTYTATPAYNWKGAVYAHQGVKIKFGRADHRGLLEPASVIEFLQTNARPVGVITTERFTVLPGTPL